jgi:hypothetical protein
MRENKKLFLATAGEPLSPLSTVIIADVEIFLSFFLSLPLSSSSPCYTNRMRTHRMRII